MAIHPGGAQRLVTTTGGSPSRDETSLRVYPFRVQERPGWSDAPASAPASGPALYAGFFPDRSGLRDVPANPTIALVTRGCEP
jgi:hypothetical protein